MCTLLRMKRKELSGPVLRDTARLSQRYPPSLRTMGFLVSKHALSAGNSLINLVRRRLLNY